VSVAVVGGEVARVVRLRPARVRAGGVDSSIEPLYAISSARSPLR
jgi:hypothetical protein